MNIKKMTALMELGCESIDLRAAEEAVLAAKNAYHSAWRLFENYGEEPDDCDVHAEYIHRGHPRWDAAMIATAPAYIAYQAAKANVRKVKRRWVTACARAQKDGC